MVRVKIEGLGELINELKNQQWIDPVQINKTVQRSANKFKSALKANYEKHKVTGALQDSIEAFQRKRKSGKDPYFTYYVGPRYTGKSSLVSYGGNAAHLLEYGTVERFRANRKEGGMGRKEGLSKVYGAKISTGKIEPLRIIQNTVDSYEGSIGEEMCQAVLDDLVKMAKEWSK